MVYRRKITLFIENHKTENTTEKYRFKLIKIITNGLAADAFHLGM